MFQFENFLIRNAQMYPDRLAFVYKSQTFTWSELNCAVNRLANAFAKLGLKKGDRIAYMFSNCAETVLVFLATQKIGATAMPINTHFLSGEIARIMDVVDCRAAVYDSRFSDTICEAQTQYGRLEYQIALHPTKADEIDLAEMLRYEDDRESQVDLSSDDESVIILTSGTTGTSKAVLRTQSMMREYGLMLAIENDNCHKSEVALTHCPFFHTACLSILVKMLALCGTFVLVDQVEPLFVFEQIEKYQVTMMLMVPPLLYMRLYDSGLWKQYNCQSLIEAQFTGGKCSIDYVNKIFEMFPNAKLRPSYGSTEVCAACSTVLSKQQYIDNPELCKTVGRINANCAIRLVDEQGNDVEVGTVGEALVKSPTVFRGYIKNDKLNQKVFTDGWFRTEDLMMRDKDGYYYLMDRKKDMIKTGGENVYAQEVEDVLRNHPSIFDCALIGVDDDRFGEAVAAAIVLNPGATLSDEDLIAYCRAKLPSYKKPRYVAFVEELPHNVTGKIQKSVLRENPKQFRPIAGLN